MQAEGEAAGAREQRRALESEALAAREQLKSARAAVAAGLALELNVTTAILSLAAATASGLVAGWYPARRAASIDVVTALRAE